jgi:hypothetical protein
LTLLPGGRGLELCQSRSHQAADRAAVHDEPPVLAEPMPGMQEQSFAIGAVGDFIAQDAYQGAALVLAHPGKAQRLAGLLWVIEQRATTGVQRAQRRPVWCGDVQHLAQVAQQHGRHRAHAVQRPAAHAHGADVQRQAQLVVIASPARDQFELDTTEAEEGLQFELGEFTRQVTQAQARCLPASHLHRSSSLGKQPKIGPAELNSSPCEISNFPDDGRAVADDANRHFLH